MSLRDRLAAKARRRLVIPVQVSDPTEDLQRAAEAEVLALAAEAQGDTEQAARIRQAAQEAVSRHVEHVAFQAMDPVDFEALSAAHVDDDGEIADRDRFTAALAAECAVDEDLRDEDWWFDQVTSGRWSSGERANLYSRLYFELNSSVPRSAYPKG